MQMPQPVKYLCQITAVLVLGQGASPQAACGISPHFVRPKAADSDRLPSCAPQLETIQSRLLDVGAAVATPRPTSADHKLQVCGVARFRVSRCGEVSMPHSLKCVCLDPV